MAAPNCPILEVSQGYMPMMNELFEESFDIHRGKVYVPKYALKIVSDRGEVN